MNDVYVLTHTDRTGEADEFNTLMGVYSSREKAADAILFWIFDNQETAEEYQEGDKLTETETYTTKESVWTVHKIEVDFVI